MTDKELHKLNRTELLELLVSLSEENEMLRTQNELQKKQLNERGILLHNAGSIAEVAMKISGVFEAAQDAADRYLDNVRSMSDNAQKKADEILEETQRKCEQMESEAQKRIDIQRDSLKTWLDRYLEAHRELKGLLP